MTRAGGLALVFAALLLGGCSFMGSAKKAQPPKTLSPAEFVRIHRSILVRKSAVRGLHPLFHGDYTVKLTDSTELTLSRTYREAFFDAMSR